jgi:polyhydroxybutyrate depolymerase
MLHGTGGNAQFAAEETGLAEFGHAHNFITIFPDGLAIDPTQAPRFLTNPQRWNDGATKPGDLLHTANDDVQFLADVIDDAVKHHGADSSRVFVTGFSNGAGMTFRFAAERSEMIRAIAPVAGYCWAKPAKPIPTLYMIGDADPLVPWHGGEVHVPWGNRKVVRPRVPDNLRKWKEACPDFREVIVPGLGHHWPGGAGRLNPRIGGPPGGEVSANEVVWGFFERK